MSTAIAEYSATEAALADLASRYGCTVYEVRTPAGLTAAKKARAEIRGYRTSLEAERKRIKAPALERCRAIDEEARRITAELLRLETPIDEAIKAEEARKEEERRARERAEAERLAAARAAIDEIRAPLVLLVGRPSSEIEAQIAVTAAIDPTAYELAGEASIAVSDTLARLRGLLDAAMSHEAEQARIAAERAELAKLRAEQEERERLERERVAAEERERARVEAEARARIEAEQQAARARIAAEEREAKSARDAADAEARKVREAADAQARAEREAEAAKLKIESDRIAAETARAEAAAREARRSAAERMDARFMLGTFVERYGRHPEFAPIAKAISEFLVA